MIALQVARLYFIGFIVLLIGTLIFFAGSFQSSSASVGGVIFIGPFPIVFGSGPDSGTLVLASLIIVAMMIAMFFSYILLARRRYEGGADKT